MINKADNENPDETAQMYLTLTCYTTWASFQISQKLKSNVCNCESEFTWCPKFHDFTLIGRICIENPDETAP